MNTINNLRKLSQNQGFRVGAHKTDACSQTYSNLHLGNHTVRSVTITFTDVRKCVQNDAISTCSDVTSTHRNMIKHLPLPRKIHLKGNSGIFKAGPYFYIFWGLKDYQIKSFGNGSVDCLS